MGETGAAGCIAGEESDTKDIHYWSLIQPKLLLFSYLVAKSSRFIFTWP